MHVASIQFEVVGKILLNPFFDALNLSKTLLIKLKVRHPQEPSHFASTSPLCETWIWDRKSKRQYDVPENMHEKHRMHSA